MFSQVPVALVAVVGLVILLVVVAVLIASRYKVAGPNEAFIVTGRKGKEIRNAETGVVSTDLSGQKVVMGGGIFVVPFVQRLHVLDLSSRRIMVQIRGAVSGQGVKLNLDGSPQGRTAWRTTAYLLPPDGQQAGYRGYPAIPDTKQVEAYLDALVARGRHHFTLQDAVDGIGASAPAVRAAIRRLPNRHCP